MISNQIMQNTIEGIKAIARVELFVADIDGKLVASTKSTGNSFESSILEFVKSPADSQEIQGCQFFKIYDDQQLEYILIANDAGENAYMVGKMAAFQGNIYNLKMYTGAQLSYVTYGQNVPDDIEYFNPQSTVKQLLGGKR